MLINFLLSGLLILACVTLLWLLSLALKNAAIVDIFWGAGFVLVAWFTALQTAPLTTRQIILLALVTTWGARLSFHILLRNHNKPEDFRYAAWRAQYGKHWGWVSFLQVFLLQGALLWLISAPLVAGLSPQTGDRLWSLVPLAAAIWGLGFYFESIGDWQLAKFKSDPQNKGKIMTQGVWAYTRHPNYFGDAAQWWGFYLLALPSGAWWTIFSPILMTYLLLNVSGVTMLEKALQERPGYAEYARRTSAFFPWPPRKE